MSAMSGVHCHTSVATTANIAQNLLPRIEPPWSRPMLCNNQKYQPKVPL